MRSYCVITFGHFLSEECIEMTVRAFSQFYGDVTPKHRKKLSLVIIEDKDHFMKVNNLVKDLNIHQVTHVVSRDDLNSIEAEMNRASVFVFNDNVKTYKIIPQILSYGLPIVCIEMIGKVENLDYTCGRVLRHRSTEGTVIDLIAEIRMLYFDAEALKFLSRGAKTKYRKEFSWGKNTTSEKVEV